MNYFALAALIVITSMCIFAILDRLCTCIERCAQARAYGKYIKHATDVSDQE